MSDSRFLPSAAPMLACLWVLGVALAAVAGAQSTQSPSAALPAASTAPKTTEKPLVVPRLPSQPGGAAQAGQLGPPAAVRLMVFSLQRQTVFDALAVVRPLLSVQGSVELDPKHNTISVRDSLAALSRVSAAIRAFDREKQPVRIDVQLIRAETAKISPVPPSTGIAPELIVRLRQLLRFENFSLLAHGQIASREGEEVAYEMAQGYRLTFDLGSVSDGKRIRLAEFRMARALPGKPEQELVHSVVHLGLDQPLILGLTQDESSDHALMLVLRYESAAVSAAGR